LSGAANSRFRYKGGEIRLDKEGNWYHEGVKITHKLTADLFSRSIKKGEGGGYVLEIGQEWAPVVVEDTPFMVRSVDLTDAGAVLTLNDGTQEQLDPETLRVGDDNVLYCEVKKGEHPARFLRPAYYQLMKRLVETDDGYALELGGKKWKVG